MKNLFLKMVTAIFCLTSMHTYAQSAETSQRSYGIWQTFGDPVSRNQVPELNGRLCNFSWKDLEPENNIWDWTAFDSDLAVRAKDTLPIIFMVYTEEDAPDWLYTDGVPKVAQKDSKGNILSYAPYYNDPDYKSFFKRMITTVKQHVETLTDSVRKRIIAVQGCYGSTGDYISYKGTVDAQYQISSSGFYSLFKEFSQYYYDEYKTTDPAIYLLSNPKNNGSDQMYWLAQNCPGGWIKTGTLGKGYQLNDEVTKSGWLYNILNVQQNGNYVRSRSEIIGSQLSSGWWNACPYKNMFALMSYCIYWGVDWSNQPADQLTDPLYDSAFGFFNKYAGQKEASQSTVAMCFLKDAIDASDEVRFPASTYGAVTRTATRFNKVLEPFKAYGAKLEDSASAISGEMGNLGATGINDVGWDIFPGNYDRYLHQVNANATSAGYWNVQSSDPNTMYGRFARGFDLANGKNGLYFDVDSAYLNNAALNGQYPVMINITYLDKGSGSWQLYYDSKNSNNKSSIAVTCANTGLWKKASVTLNDAYFGNRSINASDFYIQSTNNEDVIFNLIEVERPNANASNTGLFASSLTSFDTVCINSISNPQTLTISGSFLNDSVVTIGPFAGFSFSTGMDGIYSDSINISKYGASFKQVVYVRFNPASAGSFSGNIPLKGGGVSQINIPVVAVAVNSSPALWADITNVSCNNAKDGIIDLNTTGGTGTFTYSWTNNTNNFKSSGQDISNLIPADYTVIVSSQAGCKTSATYTVTQPDILSISLTADTMLCKAGTTTVHVAANGGTMPYVGTGSFTVNAGFQNYTVTDANGCTDKGNISVANGTLQAPSKPGIISGDAADATGLCGAGNFNYSIAPVLNASSYTWSVPLQSSISSKNTDGTAIVLNTQSIFSGGTLSVAAVNACGSSIAQTKIVSTIPGKPGTVTGPVSVKNQQQGLVYTVPAVAGLTYTWSVPGAAKIISGQNTSTITVTWGGTSGNVSVTANNSCGSSSKTALNVQLTGSLSMSDASNAVSLLYKEDAMVMPNPAKNIAYLQFYDNSSSDYTIKISDLGGSQLMSKKIRSVAGENKISMNVDHYASGIYLVTLINKNGKTKTLKLIKE